MRAVEGLAPTSYRRCSTCKDPIPFDTKYFRCSVSTCNRKKMTLVFCSISCWDAHQADARHRDAGAEEERSPTAAAWAKELAEEKQKTESKAEGAGPVAMNKVVGAASLDILVVAQRFKDYIRYRASMATSDRALGLLSDHLRQLADRAIENAGRDGRRTVMDRDVSPLVTRGSESFATGDKDTEDKSDEAMIVTSKFKAYIKARSGMNTSDGVVPLFSSYLKRLARGAIQRAGAEDRKTVLDRDFTAVIAKS
jgi:histone H3/H4